MIGNSVELISVVIPTHRRPAMARAAALSALNQTWPEVEVILVSDGPDALTRAAVADLGQRFRYLELDCNQGPAAARNAGAQASRGTWLAFLDDDDLMMPERLEKQMALADPDQPWKMISCRAWYRHGNRHDLWPRAPISGQQDVADYILVRPSLLGRPGVISIQSLLLHRSVMEQVPFSSHVEHEDWAWLLEAWHTYGVRVCFVWEPLIIYNIDTAGISRSRRLNWKESLEWAQKYRAYISDRAYCSFLATKVALKARRAGDWKGMRELAREILRSKPKATELLFLVGVMMLPVALLQKAWKLSLKSSQEIKAAFASGA